MKKIKSITIVGGGTAGWITASYFSRKFKNFFDVTIIDKKDPERIGVGEATLLNFPSIMRSMGFEDKDWIEKVDATMKAGILFPGWGEKNKTIWHPFGFTDIGGVPLYDVWTTKKNDYDLVSIQPLAKTAIDNRIELESIKDTYAEQVDCGLLVKFLQESTKNDLTYIQDDVDQVIWEGENIHSIITESGRVVNSDLFIDCSGFKRILGKHQKIIDLSDRLFMNSAIASRVEYKDIESERHPYTKCEAIDYGWVWTIPTKSRIGTGLVFNRDIIDVEDAKDRFVEYWDNRVDRESLKLIKWDPFVSEKHWIGNVVFCGLSAGFIEPLESTGLALMIRCCETLEMALYGGLFEKHDVSEFNIRMDAFYDTSVDFVNMHYSHCKLDGLFWNYVRETHQKSELQKYYEDLIIDPSSPTSRLQRHGFFSGENWTSWLIQLMDDIPEKTYFKEANHIEERWDVYIKHLENMYNESVSHKSILHNIGELPPKNTQSFTML